MWFRKNVLHSKLHICFVNTHKNPFLLADPSSPQRHTAGAACRHGSALACIRQRVRREASQRYPSQFRPPIREVPSGSLYQAALLRLFLPRSIHFPSQQKPPRLPALPQYAALQNQQYPRFFPNAAPIRTPVERETTSPLRINFLNSSNI